MLARRPNLAHFTNCIFPQFTCEFHSGTPNWPEGCYRNRASLLVTHSVGLDQSGASEPLSFQTGKLSTHFFNSNFSEHLFRSPIREYTNRQLILALSPEYAEPAKASAKLKSDRSVDRLTSVTGYHRLPT